MRVLIVTQYYEPEIGAAQVRLGAFARELTRRGHVVEVLTALPSHPEGVVHPGYRRRLSVHETRDRVRVRRYWSYPALGAGPRRLLNYVSFVVAVTLGLSARVTRRADLVFVESPPPFAFVPAWIVARLWRARLVFNVADLWPDSAVELGLLDADGLAARALARLERWIYRHADLVCAVTDGVRKVLVEDKGVPPARVLDLPNGVDVDLFRPRRAEVASVAEFTAGRRGPLFVYAGTIGFAHGVQTAVEAMAILAQRHPDATLVVAGDGSERQRVEKRARDLGLDNVVFTGPVPLAAVADLLAASTAAVSTLRDSPLFEGTRPSKIFPAFAAGRPVLYSGAGEGARLVADSGAGIVTPPEDPAGLAAAMATVIDDPDGARRMGESGRRLAEERFSWPAIVEGWLDQLPGTGDGS